MASGLSLTTRFALIAVFAMAGFAIQMMYSIFWGWACVFVAVLLGLVRKESNEPSISHESEWTNVTMDEFQAAGDLLKKTDRWRSKTSAFSCGGCALGAAVILGVVLVASILGAFADVDVTEDLVTRPVTQGGSVALVFAIDALTLILPVWIFGGAAAWEPPDMRKKINQLTHIYEGLSRVPDLQWQPSMLVAKTNGGSVPLDCRLTAKLRDSDPNFIGIQMQTSLNYVQGTAYPYTYAVLIAKPEFCLIEKAKQVVDMPPEGGFGGGRLGDANEQKEAIYPRFEGVIVELDTEKDVEIAVVRQGTGGGGYRTSEERALNVVRIGLRLASNILKL